MTYTTKQRKRASQGFPGKIQRKNHRRFFLHVLQQQRISLLFGRPPKDVRLAPSQPDGHLGSHPVCLRTGLPTFRICRHGAPRQKKRIPPFYPQLRRQANQYPPLVPVPLDMAQPPYRMVLQIIHQRTFTHTRRLF